MPPLTPFFAAARFLLPPTASLIVADIRLFFDDFDIDATLAVISADFAFATSHADAIYADAYAISSDDFIIFRRR